ncbi:MAG: CheR family methyltransferase [Kofleriaceae bacterium]
MKVSPDAARYLRDFVYRHAGIVLDDDKDYLIESRLIGVARDAHLRSLDELVAAIRVAERGAIAIATLEALTTNETSFFRDSHPFRALVELVPSLIKARAASRTLRIWSAAASTGQEPYSIAMLLREHFPELASWDVRITATDINRCVLERARAGTYRTLEINRGLPAAYLAKYFVRRGADWQIAQPIRDLVRFAELNLLADWACLAGAQDVVFLRNVLIYFDHATKVRIFERVRRVLRPDSALFLGAAETPLHFHDGFQSMRAGPTIYYALKRAEVNHAA